MKANIFYYIFFILTCVFGYYITNIFYWVLDDIVRMIFHVLITLVIFLVIMKRKNYNGSIFQLINITFLSVFFSIILLYDYFFGLFECYKKNNVTYCVESDFSYYSDPIILAIALGSVILLIHSLFKRRRKYILLSLLALILTFIFLAIHV